MAGRGTIPGPDPGLEMERAGAGGGAALSCLLPPGSALPTIRTLRQDTNDIFRIPTFRVGPSSFNMVKFEI